MLSLGHAAQHRLPTINLPPNSVNLRQTGFCLSTADFETLADQRPQGALAAGPEHNADRDHMYVQSITGCCPRVSGAAMHASLALILANFRLGFPGRYEACNHNQ